MLFDALRQLRNKRLWALVGVVGVLYVFWANYTHQTTGVFAGLSVACFAAALYQASVSIHRITKLGAFWVPVVLGCLLLNAGGVFNVQEFGQKNIELVGAVTLLVVSWVGTYYLLLGKKQKTGQWSSANQPGA